MLSLKSASRNSKATNFFSVDIVNPLTERGFSFFSGLIIYSQIAIITLFTVLPARYIQLTNCRYGTLYVFIVL